MLDTTLVDIKSGLSSLSSNLHGVTITVEDVIRLIPIFFAAGIAYFLSDAIYNLYFHPLAHIPGPFWAKISNIYCVRMFLSRELEKKEWALHEKYGRVVRIQPNQITISDPRFIPAIFHKDADRPMWKEMSLLGLGGTSFNAKSSTDHKKARRRIAPAYSMNSIRKMEHFIDTRLVEMLGVFDERFVQQKQLCDFGAWSSYVAYDIVSDIVFGKRFGFLKAGADVGDLIKNFQVALPAVGVLNRMRWINDLIMAIPGFGTLMKPSPSAKTGIGALMRFRDRLVERRYADIATKKRPDLLHNFINATNDDGTPMSLNDVKAEALIVMFAGSDTTASLMRKVIFYVIEEPSIYRKLRYEVDKAYTSFGPGIPSFPELVNLPYLAACIHEALRLGPPSPHPVQRLISAGPGIQCHGYHLPPGTIVNMNPWVVGRDKKLYGPDADQYRPERWIEADLETKQLWDKLEFAFSSGPRICVGKNIALMEVYKVIALLIRYFDLTGSGPPPGVSTYQREENLSVVVQEGFWLKLRRRDVKEWEEVDSFFARNEVMEDDKDIQL
ncbi:cytochrome P450 [Ascobolus immersus RN42]|uniref:Cytochrome P450 n=1 Tax=Ascobolus immersus RN42 TaxID=1160509 RepID=A0A3N4INP5_ASCIM|nr:cytochrome P450 [Ascobolus immersus RN42]